MIPIRPLCVVLLAALLCACQSTPPRHPVAKPATPSSAAWRGIALIDDAAQAPREGTLEVVLVAMGSNDIKTLAHAEFAVQPSARIEFELPVDPASDVPSARLGWRVWLRDASGHLCYGSERLVAANRDATATVPLTRVAPR